MSKYGTYKVVGGKVVQVVEAKRYEPEPVKLKQKEACRCALCTVEALMGEQAQVEAAAQTAPVVEPELHTGVYL
jgi:hypothetical protein